MSCAACGEICGCGKRSYVDTTKTNDDNANSNVKDDVTVVHHIPFKIEYEGHANVDDKFTVKSVSLPSDPKVLCNQFRGRPLQGQNVDLPEDYEGFIATDLKKSDSNDTSEKTEISIGKRFNSLTYWNWDRIPSGMDKHVKLVNWLELSQVLHAPIDN